MFRYLCRKILHVSTKDSRTHPYFVENPCLKSISHISNTTNQQSFTVSYLINSCGLSEAAALSAATKVQFNTTEKPDSALAFFQNHGFTKSHITHLITKYPLFLLANPDKTLKPKFEFFYSFGFTGMDLAKLFTSDPALLHRSLNNQIIPSFNFIKSILHTNDNIIFAVRRAPHILQCNLEKVMAPNVAVLQNYGVPNSMISKLISSHSRTLNLNNSRFSEIVAMVKKTGFNPVKAHFIVAVRVMSGMSKLNWEGKVGVLRSLGWSEDEIFSSFKMYPVYMVISEQKIRRGMDFFVNKMNCKPSVISRNPNILSYSLEKRVVPRCSVLQVLMSKGLIKKDLCLSPVLTASEKKFLEKFVIKNQERVPEILSVYKGKMELLG
ncbi:transcription termination factor MTERF15, mitochondrial-like [Tasmannia lanceolata]|uniref:transcription termination factor MTERF15, mitochondrial-like n=1 Tax=Tasmannia lanceolata TaxID=3420 RepID=UPI004064BFFB